MHVKHVKRYMFFASKHSLSMEANRVHVIGNSDDTY